MSEQFYKAREGDEEAQEAFFSEVIDNLSRFYPDDVVEETVISVLTHMDEFEGRSSPETWVNRIARNENITKATREKPTENIDEMKLSSSAIDPETQTIVNDLIEKTIESMQHLPDRQRNVMMLRSEGLTHKEIAEELGINKNHSHQALHQAKEKIKKLMYLNHGYKVGG